MSAIATGLAATSLAAAYANLKASWLSRIQDWNNDLITIWKGYFEHSFLVQLNACTIAATSQPTPPPPSWILVEAPGIKDDLSNVTPEALNAMTVAQTGPAVCPIPAFAPPVTVPSGSIAVAADPSIPATLPVPAGDIMPIGYETTNPANGATYKKVQSVNPFGVEVWYQRIGVLLLCALALFAARPARAQVTIACSPQPIISMSSLGKAVMGEWGCFISNAAAVPRTISVEEFYAAILQIRPITPNVAVQILNDRQARTVPAKIVTVIDKIAKPLGPPVGAVLTIISKSNAVTGVIIAAASQGFGTIADPLVGVAQSQIPSTTPYTTDLFSAPITLAAGSGATKVVYAAKQKAPAPIAVKLP